jgi:hypothetical protein
MARKAASVAVFDYVVKIQKQVLFNKKIRLKNGVFLQRLSTSLNIDYQTFKTGKKHG